MTTVEESPVGSTITSVAPDRERESKREPITVPAHRYISAEFAQREHDELWPRVWQLACTVDHVANPGDFYDYQVGLLSVLIVRGDDGVLRAFQNVCLHRGNELCSGSGSDLSEIRCQYHRWCWDLRGHLREVPSRRGFGVIDNDSYGLIAARVDTWGPLVFVSLDVAAEPLADYLEGVPDDAAWAGLDDFRCQYLVTTRMPCNWKTLIDGFSETLHVQGIHREMLPMTDDVNSPQRLWNRHGKLSQPYGVPSPRLRAKPDDQGVWDAFVEVMGTRIGVASGEPAGPVPPIPADSSLRAVLAERIRAVGREQGIDFSHYSDAQMLDMQQYNLFPNITVLVFPDLLSVVRARPGDTPDDCSMDVFFFTRRPTGDASPRTKPLDMDLPPDQVQLGTVLNQDVANLRRAQRGLHQPGFTRLTLSGEECRIRNLHRNLEEWLGIEPSEIGGDAS
jgi:nitrite reductase/ring-hydroxylating ferredoxin subunit